MSRRWAALPWWVVMAALIGGLSSGVDGFVLGLLGGVVLSDDPLAAALWLAAILGILGASGGAIVGAMAWWVAPKLVLPPPDEGDRARRAP